jgi:hypothetical protein
VGPPARKRQGGVVANAGGAVLIVLCFVIGGIVVIRYGDDQSGKNFQGVSPITLVVYVDDPV